MQSKEKLSNKRKNHTADLMGSCLESQQWFSVQTGHITLRSPHLLSKLRKACSWPVSESLRLICVEKYLFALNKSAPFLQDHSNTSSRLALAHFSALFVISRSF